MQLTPLKANMTELDTNGMKVLFSYKTPVAARLTTADGLSIWYQTEKKWSATTTRHVKKWLASYGDPGAQFKPQEFFDRLIDGTSNLLQGVKL